MKYFGKMVAFSIVFFTAISLNAGGTKLWEIADYKEFSKGDLQGTILSSKGEINLGTKTIKADLSNVGLVWSVAKSPTGKIYLGTGYDGKIFRIDKNKAVEIATTKGLVVTSLTFDKKGNLYAAALQKPIVWKIINPEQIKADHPVDAKPWATLPPKSSPHIWALSFNKAGSILFAGTGPSGKIFSIAKNGNASVYLDTDEKHILSLFLSQKGNLLAGTSPNALLLKVTNPGRFSTLADFEGTEVKAISQNDKFGIFAAVNTFKSPPSIPFKSTLNSKLATVKKNSKVSKSGDGAIYRIFDGGHNEKLWHKKSNHISSLVLDKKGTVFAGLSTDGKVISVDLDRTIKTVLDLDERQVMGLLAQDNLEFACTGDSGAAYTITKTRSSEAFYITPALDTGAVSTWGVFNWFGIGQLQVKARCGNTSFPDNSWTSWSKKLSKEKTVSLKRARYLQFKFSWKNDPNAILRSVQLAFKPQNIRAIITAFNANSLFGLPKTKFSSISKKGKNKLTSNRIISTKPPAKKSNELKLFWKTTNVDNDKLRYRLYYKKEGEEKWRPMLQESNILTKNTYSWITSNIPEGRYHLKLTADDSLSNTMDEVLTDQYLSVPVLVDNHQPHIENLSYKQNLISGTAVDSFSAISSLEYSIDDGSWFPAPCKDNLFDEKSEGFSFKLPVSIDKGSHSVGVKAYDSSGNIGIQELLIDIK